MTALSMPASVAAHQWAHKREYCVKLGPAHGAVTSLTHDEVTHKSALNALASCAISIFKTTSKLPQHALPRRRSALKTGNAEGCIVASIAGRECFPPLLMLWRGMQTLWQPRAAHRRRSRPRWSVSAAQQRAPRPRLPGCALTRPLPPCTLSGSSRCCAAASSRHVAHLKEKAHSTTAFLQGRSRKAYGMAATSPRLSGERAAGGGTERMAMQKDDAQHSDKLASQAQASSLMRTNLRCSKEPQAHCLGGHRSMRLSTAARMRLCSAGWPAPRRLRPQGPAVRRAPRPPQPPGAPSWPSSAGAGLRVT